MADHAVHTSACLLPNLFSALSRMLVRRIHPTERGSKLNVLVHHAHPCGHP
jgi:hypothetical protein